MPFNTAGFALVLDLATDATSGINKVSVYTNLALKTSQTITFGTPSSNEYGGSVVSSNTPLSFNITANEIVQAIGLFHDATQIAYIEVTEVTDTNAYVYVIDSITINLT